MVITCASAQVDGLLSVLHMQALLQVYKNTSNSRCCTTPFCSLAAKQHMHEVNHAAVVKPHTQPGQADGSLLLTGRAA